MPVVVSIVELANLLQQVLVDQVAIGYQNQAHPRGDIAHQTTTLITHPAVFHPKPAVQADITTTVLVAVGLRTQLARLAMVGFLIRHPDMVVVDQG